MNGDQMNSLKSIGRWFVAASMIVFGTQHFLYARFVAGLVPAWIPGRLFFAYFADVAFVAAAVSIVSKEMAGLTATLLGAMFLLFVVIVHAPRIAAHSGNGNEWTSGFVALAMCGGAWCSRGVCEEKKEHKQRVAVVL